MEQLIEAIKSNDLVKAKKAFGAIMSERKLSLVESRKLEIARSVLIEGEESEEDDQEKDNAEEKRRPNKAEDKESDEQEDDEEDDDEEDE